MLRGQVFLRSRNQTRGFLVWRFSENFPGANGQTGLERTKSRIRTIFIVLAWQLLHFNSDVREWRNPSRFVSLEISALARWRLTKQNRQVYNPFLQLFFFSLPFFSLPFFFTISTFQPWYRGNRASHAGEIITRNFARFHFAKINPRALSSRALGFDFSRKRGKPRAIRAIV